MITLIRQITSFKNLARCALTISLLGSGAGFAQTQPDAGQILRELQQSPIPISPQSEPKLGVEEPVHEQHQSADLRFMVKSFHISGNSVIPTDKLQSLVAYLVGTDSSLSELNAAAARITFYYRALGYPVARAYLPAQTVKDGEVAINIIEGRIAKYRIDNQSRLSEERANAFLDPIHAGDVIKSTEIDRSLLLLNDTPGVGGARATLLPGISVGTSDLLVELRPASVYSGSVNLDNFGNRYTGQHQLSGTFNINSPLKIGDQITLSALTSDQDLTHWRAAYQFPIGSNGLRLGASYSDLRYRLGKEFESLQANGQATNDTVFISYPFIRGQQKNLTGLIVWESISLADTVSARRIQLANLNLSGDHRDGWGGGGVISLDLSYKLGQLDIGSPSALAIDNGSARTNGAYTRLTYNANRLQRLNSSNYLSFTISGQQANKNLDSAEKFTLGGVRGVRAYPQGEGVGDQGYLVNLELMHDFTTALQGTLFYDTGSVVIAHNPFGSPISNHRNLSGAGVGFNAHLAGIQVKASLAWRISGGEPTSIPPSVASTTTLWIQAAKTF